MIGSSGGPVAVPSGAPFTAKRLAGMLLAFLLFAAAFAYLIYAV